MVKIQSKDTHQSGIDCHRPSLVRSFARVPDARFRVSGHAAFCQTTGSLLHFGKRLSFFDAEKISSIFWPPAPKEPQTEPAGPPPGTGAEDPSAESEPARIDLVALNSSALDYPEAFAKEKDSLLSESPQVFHVDSEFADAKTGDSDLFLALFGNKALVVSLSGSVKEFQVFPFDPHPRNQVAVSKLLMEAGVIGGNFHVAVYLFEKQALQFFRLDPLGKELIAGPVQDLSHMAAQSDVGLAFDYHPALDLHYLLMVSPRGLFKFNLGHARPV